MFLFKTNELPGIMEVEINGEITENNMKEFKSHFDQKKEDHDKLKLLIEVKEMDYTLEGFIEGFKFDINHFNDFEKIAVLSDKEWLGLSSKLADYLPKVEVKHFDSNERDKAIYWLD